MRNSNKIFANVDWNLILIYLVLVILGWLTIYSTGYTEDHPNIFDFSKESGKQFMWIVTSLFLGMAILLLDVKFFWNNAYVFYGVVVFMLIAVLFTSPINGARSWFGFGGMGIQPSEFAKFATAIAVAKFLSSSNAILKQKSTKYIITGLIAFPAALILLQPDPGTLLVFISFIFVLYREGLSGNLLLLGLYAVVLSITAIFMKFSEVELPFFGQVNGQWPLVIILTLISLFSFFLIKTFILKRGRKSAFFKLIGAFIMSMVMISVTNFAFDHVLKERHRNRIMVTFGIKEDPRGVGYNTNQAMAAIGSGGTFGKGYMNGTLSNNRFGHVPEQSTDFIFCPVAEEWGFVGGLVLISLFLTLLVKIILIAERQRSSFTRIYGYSVAGIIFFHLMINLGMAIGLAPVIGIPLPFFSYGGSSLWSFTILIFILVKLDASRLETYR